MPDPRVGAEDQMNQKPVVTNCQPTVGREEMELNCRWEAEEFL